jgi:hypothetical protein
VRVEMKNEENDSVNIGLPSRESTRHQLERGSSPPKKDFKNNTMSFKQKYNVIRNNNIGIGKRLAHKAQQ